MPQVTQLIAGLLVIAVVALYVQRAWSLHRSGAPRSHTIQPLIFLAMYVVALVVIGLWLQAS